jgi:hypothetical protein
MFDEVVVTGFLVLGNGALGVFFLLGHRRRIIGSSPAAGDSLRSRYAIAVPDVFYRALPGGTHP